MQLGFLEGISSDHKHKERVKAEGAQPRPRTVRLGKEIAGLNNDLPLNPTSSVFVRVDEQNCSLWRALITGMLRLLLRVCMHSPSNLQRAWLDYGDRCRAILV